MASTPRTSTNPPCELCGDPEAYPITILGDGHDEQLCHEHIDRDERPMSLLWPPCQECGAPTPLVGQRCSDCRGK